MYGASCDGVGPSNLPPVGDAESGFSQDFNSFWYSSIKQSEGGGYG